MRSILAFLLFHILLLQVSSRGIGGSFPVKHLAGLPEEFAAHRVPNPADFITYERSASEMIWFTASSTKDNSVYTSSIPVDGPSEFVFTFASPHADQLTLELLDPNGKEVDLNLYGKQTSFAIGSDIKLPAMAYTITDSQRGYYTLNIRSDAFSPSDLKALSQSPYPNAVLTVINNDYVEIQSHLSSYLLKEGQEIGIISTVVDLSPTASVENIRVTSALMEVITPEGQDLEIAMTDDDPVLERFGYAPHSGVYGARVTTQSSGEFIVQALLQGLYSDNQSNVEVPFLRSTEHVMEVSSATLSLTGSSSVRLLDPTHVAIDIQTTGNGNKLRAYAEVWGLDLETNQPKAACWIGGIVENVNNVVTLELDLAWLMLSGVTPPLTLHNVYVSDLTTSFPVTIATSEMAVQHSEEIIQINQYSNDIQITNEMRQGRNPLKRVKATADVPTLLLLPGYCASFNPWKPNESYFTDGAYLVTNGANLGHQEFAEKAMAYAQSLNMDSYSAIGHSQGGMVALHIRNYYFTGLDAAEGSRLIQSVGAPYQGCTAAGSLANLGKIFGVACGSNNDLSIDGAANWLTGITQDARQQVYYYTTTYKQGTFFGDSCSLAMNLVLQWPNDGTTEIKYATLDQGTNVGNKQEWCHTSGMNYEPQYNDNNRNAEMNKLASR